MSKYQAVGIEETDHAKCECCGAVCTRRRVVVQNIETQEYRKLGSICASYALYGRRDRQMADKIIVKLESKQNKAIVDQAYEAAKKGTITIQEARYINSHIHTKYKKAHDAIKIILEKMNMA